MWIDNVLNERFFFFLSFYSFSDTLYSSFSITPLSSFFFFLFSFSYGYGTISVIPSFSPLRSRSFSLSTGLIKAHLRRQQAHAEVYLEVQTWRAAPPVLLSPSIAVLLAVLFFFLLLCLPSSALLFAVPIKKVSSVVLSFKSETLTKPMKNVSYLKTPIIVFKFHKEVIYQISADYLSSDWFLISRG